MSDEITGKLRVSFNDGPWEDVPQAAAHGLFAAGKDGQLIAPLILIDIADLRDVISIAEEADVYIDPRLAALDRLIALIGDA